MTDYEYQRHYLYQDDLEKPDPEKVWKCAQAHRERVTQIALGTEPAPGSRLAVMGVGNGNDLALKELAKHFAEIHLIDIDGPACWKGLELQGMTHHDGIKIHGGVDVTGVGNRLSELGGKGSDAEYQQVINILESFRLPDLSGKFDTVLSTCLLSQLNHHAIGCLGESHEKMLEILLAIRIGHFKLMLDLCKPTGTAVLIFDFVSSGTLPGIEGFSGEDLRMLLAKAIKQQNFFHGMNPIMINETLVNDPRIKDEIEVQGSAPPWVWDTSMRHYAVTAVRFARAGS